MNLPKGYINQTIEQALYPKLSPQELEIVKLYTMGLSIKEIANQTFLEPMGVGHTYPTNRNHNRPDFTDHPAKNFKHSKLLGDKMIKQIGVLDSLLKK